jgi:hypothetical protein
MQHSILILISAVFLSASSCKTKENSAGGASAETKPAATSPASPATSNPQTVNTSKSWTREEAKAGPDNFRLVVSFISIGAGTDPDAKQSLDRYIADFKTRTGKMPAYVMIPWGREGEVDCCFNMEELTASEQGDFIAGLRNTMKSRELIQINENARNRFKP